MVNPENSLGKYTPLSAVAKKNKHFENKKTT